VVVNPVGDSFRFLEQALVAKQHLDRQGTARLRRPVQQEPAAAINQGVGVVDSVSERSHGAHIRLRSVAPLPSSRLSPPRVSVIITAAVSPYQTRSRHVRSGFEEYGRTEVPSGPMVATLPHRVTESYAGSRTRIAQPKASVRSVIGTPIRAYSQNPIGTRSS